MLLAQTTSIDVHLPDMLCKEKKGNTLINLQLITTGAASLVNFQFSLVSNQIN